MKKSRALFAILQSQTFLLLKVLDFSLDQVILIKHIFLCRYVDEEYQMLIHKIFRL